MHKILVAVFLLVGLGAERALATGLIADANGFNFSDSFAHSGATNAYGRTFWDVALGLPLSEKRRFWLAWNYDSYSFTDTSTSTTTTLTVTDMGPKFIFYLNKDRTWVVALVYGLLTNGSYDPGTGSSVLLQGSSLRAEAGYTINMTESFLMGAKLNYYQATFTQEITNQTTIAQVGDSRTIIYPSFSFTYRFE